MNAELRQSDYVVFLLGAGYSCEYRLPAMNQFMDVAQDKYFAYRRANSPAIQALVKCYEDMLTFHQSCNKSASRIKMKWDNIEELYTQADLRRLAQIPNKLEADSLCSSIAWAIWDVYRYPGNVNQHTSMLSITRDALAQVEKKGYTPAVITTNYDVCVERSLRRGDRPLSFVYPAFEPDDRKKAPYLKPTDADFPTFNKVAKVVKLHGSVSWFYAGDTEDYVALDTYGTNSVFDVDADDLNYENFVSERIVKYFGGNMTAARPAIIPPMLGKGSTSKLFASQWKAAIDILARAKYIFVIGYSFPTTDAFMKRLLSDALKDNHTLRHMCVIDLASKQEWEVRLRDLFNPLFYDTRVTFVQSKARACLHHLASLDVDDWPTKVKAVDGNIS